ncbi:MAG: hypothetical protein WC793_01710 [Candidatus Paceibacterota bacterium]|jgi:hypothetical protein
MNTKIKLSMKLFMLGVVTLLGIFAVATPASATSNITCNSATISAWVDPMGVTTTAWFVWGTTTSFGQQSQPQDYNSYQSFSYNLTGLSPNTTYYWNSKFHNNSRGYWDGTSIQSFTTLSCTPPPPTIFTVTAIAGTGGSINPPSQTVTSGYTANVYVTANQGYTINQVTGCGVFYNGGSTYTTGAIHSDCTINASFTQNAPTTYTVTATAGQGGSITPSGNQQVNAGNTTSFTVTPNSGYTGSVSGCNGSQLNNITSATTYTTGTINSACTVYASFTQNAPNPATGSLTISPSSCIIASGASTCTVTGATWTTTNATNPALIDGNTGATLSTAANNTNPLLVYVGYPYTIFNLKNGSTILDTKSAISSCANGSSWNGSICASNAPNQYTVTATAGQGGSITPSGNQQVNAGNTTSFTVTPNSGYTGSVSGCNGSQLNNITSATTYTTGTINSACTVYASFTQNAPNPTNPAVQLTADNQNVTYNGSTVLRWNATNATSCIGSGNSSYWSGSVGLSGPWNTGSLTNTTTFNITCYGANGTTPAFSTVTVTVNQNQTCQDPNAINYGGSLPCRYQTQGPTVTIYANPSSINYNGTSLVIWNSNGATSCTANGGTNGWSGNQSTSGSFYTNTLTNTTTYGITCTNNTGQQANASTTIYVNNQTQYPTVNIYASPASVSYNGTSLITWNSNNATSCNGTSGTNGWAGNRSTSGSFYTGNLTYATNYGITCTSNTGQQASSSTTVYVDNQQVVNNQPTVVVYSDQTNVDFNGAATVRWITTNATSCNASGGSVGWAGAKSIGPGSFYTGSLTSSKTYEITCSNAFGSASDSQTITVRGQINRNPITPSSLVLITSSVDRNQPIVPTIDNTMPKPGDEINYTVSYQNIGNASITGLTLQMNLPLEVDYLFSNPSNPSISGNTLYFNLGSLRANGKGVVTVRVRVRDNIKAGTALNFPATLSYIDPSGQPQSVSANVSAQVWKDGTGINFLGANVFGAGFLPTNLFGWLLLLILILILVFLAKYLYDQSFQKKTTTVVDQPSGKKTTTTTLQ